MSDGTGNPSTNGPVIVTIFNQGYSLRSPNGAERVTKVAQVVDERMKLIAAQITSYDVAKIAVLAALNIADELQALKDLQAQEEQPALSQKSEARDPDEESDKAKSEALTQASENREAHSWFEDIFDSDPLPRPNRERMSNRISAKLQMLRQSEQEGITIHPNEDQNKTT